MKEEQNVKKASVPKAFAGVYYTAIALVAVLLLIFSLVTYYFLPASTSTSVDTASAYAVAGRISGMDRSTSSGKDSAVAEIVSALDDMGLTSAPATKQRSNATVKSEQQKVTATTGNGPTYTVMDFSAENIGFVIDRDTVTDMSHGDDETEQQFVYASGDIADVIVVIPGSSEVAATERDAVLVMTHYDSMPGSDGAASAASVSAMLGAIDTLVSSDYAPSNDVVFAFTDGRYENSVGAYAMLNQFVGFDGVMDRIGAVFNFDALTAGGTLTVVDTSDADSAIMTAYAASGASVRADSSVTSLMNDRVASDFDIIYDSHNDEYDVPGINFMLTGGESTAGASGDDMDVVTESTVAQYASAMEAIARYFGNADLSALTSATDASAFTWMGLNGVADGAVVYVLAAVLVLLLVGNLVLAAKKRSFGVLSAVKGAGGVLLSLAASLAAMYVAYFIIGLLSVAFGAVTMNMLVSAQFLTPAVLVPAIAFAAATGCAFFPVLKRAFKIKAGDCVRGAALLQMLVAIGFGFIAPYAAMPFAIVGLLNGAVMLISSLVKKAFSRRFGFGIERLFLYTLPAMVGIPFMVQAIMSVFNLFPIVYLPFMMTAVVLLFASITPYFDYLQPKLTDAFAKLPKHTVPVVETVVEDREDVAKKGKFETVSETRVVKHQVAWKYHNWFGVTVLLVVTLVLLLILTPVSNALSINENANRTAAFDYTYAQSSDSVFDNAIVIYVDSTYSASGRYDILIKDEEVYRTIRYFGDNGEYDYWNWSWNDTFMAYDQTVNVSSPPATATLIASTEDEDDGKESYSITPNYPASSQVKLTVSGLESGDVISVSSDGEEDPDYYLTVSDPSADVEVVLPTGYGNCTLDIETEASIDIEAYEYYAAGTEAPGSLNDAYVRYDSLREFFNERGMELNISFILKAGA